MTNENIIKQLKRLIPSLQYADDVNAVKGAIKALSQESKTDEENVHREREQAYMQGYEDASKKYRQELIKRVECTDAVSRQAVLDGLRGCICDEWVKTLFATMVKQLPSITQKSGKWIDREEYDADRWKCSVCGRTEQYKENFCPNCGVKMESEE